MSHLPYAFIVSACKEFIVTEMKTLEKFQEATEINNKHIGIILVM